MKSRYIGLPVLIAALIVGGLICLVLGGRSPSAVAGASIAPLTPTDGAERYPPALPYKLC